MKYAGLFCLTEFQGFKLLEVSRCTELIEDMIIPLFIRLENKERKKNINSILDYLRSTVGSICSILLRHKKPKTKFEGLRKTDVQNKSITAHEESCTHLKWQVMLVQILPFMQ